MVNVFSGDNANDVWIKALTLLEDTTISKSVPSRAGNIKEILHAVFEISNPRQRWVISRVPPINPAFALAELVWIVSGSRESKLINFWNPSLPKYAGKSNEYHGAYGYRLRRHYGFDQLEKAYLSLKENPYGRQNVLLIWDPNSDAPDETGNPVSEDIPCNICSLLKIRDNHLEWTQIIRSNDIFLGVPYNFVQFTCLQEMLAGWLGVELGSYIQLSDSLHLYDTNNYVKSSTENIAYSTDSIAIPKDESERLFSSIYQNMCAISDIAITKSEFIKYAFLGSTNNAFNNIMLVISADAARRRGWTNEYREIINSCTNLAYKKLWSNWLERTKNE